MKAFLSYSVSDNNEYILTVLSLKLRENNFSINTNLSSYHNILDFNTIKQIGSSHLFIGIVTEKGNEIKRVLDEWEYAVKENIPNILMIEDRVSVPSHFKGNIIRFNMANPERAINEIQNRMNPPKEKSSNIHELVPWLLGGAAILAAIGLFAKKN